MAIGSVFGLITGQNLDSKQEAIQRKQMALNNKFRNENAQQEGEIINKSADTEEANSKGAANDRGLYNSSIPQGESKQIEYGRDQKVKSLNRRIKYGNEASALGGEADAISREIQSSQQMISQMNQFTQSGL